MEKNFIDAVEHKVKIDTKYDQAYQEKDRDIGQKE